MGQPAVFAEILINIQSINLTLGLPKEISSLKLGIYPLCLSLEEQVAQPNTNVSYTLNLFHTVEATQQPSIISSADGLDVKLKLRSYVRKKPTRQTIGGDILPPLSATEISTLRNILCSFCKASLVKPNAFLKMMDLPSEHWLELIDCWMCHQEDYQQVQLGEFITKENVGMVGNTYIFVHPKDVLNDSLVLEDGSPDIDWEKGLSRKWRPLSCSRCLGPVGEGLYALEGNEKETTSSCDPVLLVVKFSKYMTAMELGILGFRSKIETHGFAPFVATEFLEAAKAHATYRFIIEERRSRKPYLLVGLFSWETKIMTNALDGLSAWEKFSNHVANYNQIIPTKMTSKEVLKLLYIDCAENGSESAQRLLTQWQADKTVERFLYPEEVCLEILLVLRLSTNYLPPSKRIMNDFYVGFMDRID
ncbi:hypothetical protein G9A89_020677 [Geosiphon pyriformis]|nr:hypothetical protein G9A89_020677 [Geosiphon pyriformis]